MKLKKSRFTENLVRLNSLSFRRWVFEPGMEFLSESKWWGDRGHRGQRHNGLDLLFYETDKGELRTLEEDTKIPIIYEGRIVKSVEDFLGYTLFAAHEIYDGDFQLFTLYGHVLQFPDIAGGEPLSEGTIIATLPATRGGKVPIHLHISAALTPKNLPLENLSWKRLNETEDITFFDPREII